MKKRKRTRKHKTSRKAGSKSIKNLTASTSLILSNENEILSRWREYFEDLVNPESTCDIQEVTHLGEEEVLTAAEVATAIKDIKSGKASGEDEIRSEMLKALTGEEILYLTRGCQVAWKFGKTSRDWQTDVIIPIFKKENRKQCPSYRGISLFSFPGKVYAECLKSKCREIVKSCFVDLEKAYNRVPWDKLWKALREYGVDGQLLRSIKSFYCRPKVSVGINGKQSKLSHVGVGLREGYVLLPLLFY